MRRLARVRWKLSSSLDRSNGIFSRRPCKAEPGGGTHRAAGTKPVIGGCIPAGDGHEISENHPTLADGLPAAAHPAGRIVRPSRLIVGPAKRIRKTATRSGSNSCSLTDAGLLPSRDGADVPRLSAVRNAMTRIVFVLALLFTAPWQEAEIVDVKDRGAVDLKPFACQDITRSSLISRVCYDAESRRMLVQRHAVYRQYCDLPQDTIDTFLNAPSMGQFFKANIEGADAGSLYACLPDGAR
jgi:hypothetical protein